jgi:hydroxypyruvate reductase
VLADDAHRIYEAAIAGARPDALLTHLVARLGAHALAPRALPAYARIVVVGAGKGALAMAGAAERVLEDAGGVPIHGQVAVPHGYGAHVPADLPRPRRIAVREAGHPAADTHSEAAARAALELARGCGPNDLLVVLLSGGASALWGAPAAGVPADDVRAVVGALQRAGADIAALNAVRKHLALLGGGQLAAAAGGDVVTLALSDVIGDDPSVIGSGPTAPDPTTHTDAIRTLRAHGVWDRASRRVRTHLQGGAADATRETPKPRDPVFARTRLHLLGGIADALAAARVAARALGYDASVRGGALAGEARDAGRLVARAAIGATRQGAPACVLWGGETTVTVRGRGTGGRNQELALAAALALDEGARIGALPPDADLVVLSGGTDGIDGPTDAAGAWVTPHTVADARARGHDARGALDDNDAYHFFTGARADAGGLLRPGPTHTNVMDVQVVLARQALPDAHSATSSSAE